jgi:16S rRNA (cytosine1402-N4)-methyltransferase
VSDEAPRPPRRKRYSGKNPRNFEDKYKEHDPARFADTVAKVIASGKTPAGTHIPILVAESLDALALEPGMIGVDATLGYGGHALKILERISPAGKLIGLDVDPLELPKTETRIREFSYSEAQFQAHRSNYAGIARAMTDHQLNAVDFVFADLGCSSMQLDDPSRGFSFKTTGPLDMRMNPGRGLSAADWLAKVSREKLATVLHQNADEPRAETLATALAGAWFPTTLALAQAIRESIRVSDEDERELTVRRVFQAVRIAVNEEFHALDAFLRAVPTCLKPAGRIAILTFHSGEDRRVKQAFKDGVQEGFYSGICEKPITASPEERRMNPRSTSAKLRWAIRA